MKKAWMVTVLLCVAATTAFSQGMPPGENVIGKVTAVSGNTLTVAPMTGGNPVTVKIGDDTRIRKDRQPAKAADIKVDDMVFARGTLTGTIMDAAIIGLVNPEMVQRMQQGGAGQFNREDLGKKFIVGEVKAINELKLTIARPDNQTQEIEVDENTSFHKGRESVTLADIKVGDFVRGSGELKNGVFMPKELIVGPPGIVMGFGGPRGQGGARMDPDAMGKTFIAGRATTVSGNKITVMRNDGQSQEITIDSATSLRLMPGNAGITLADIKAGDRVRGPGELKNGVFVPRELVVNHPRDNEAPGGEKPQLPASPKN